MPPSISSSSGDSLRSTVATPTATMRTYDSQPTLRPRASNDGSAMNADADEKGQASQPIQPQATDTEPDQVVSVPARGTLASCIGPLIGASVMLFVVVFATSVWFYGTMHGAGQRVNKLKVLIRDFDNGEFGRALTLAAANVNGPKTVPTFVLSQDMSVEDVAQAVFRGDYWAAIVANAGVTEAWDTALKQAITTPATNHSYTPSDTYTTYFATARFFTSYSSYVRPGVQQVLGLAAAQSVAYAMDEAISLLVANGSTSGLPAAASRLVAQPTTSGENDLGPLPFEARVLINTFGIVVPALVQFFFNMALNGIFLAFGIYTTPTTWRRLTSLKFPIKFVWTVLTSLAATSWPLIFAEGWKVGAKGFFALWLIQWAYCYISFNFYGILLAFVDLKFVSLFVFPSIVTSIAATIVPIELSNQFYRISYMFPSHAYWSIAITVYGRGITNKLTIYAPVFTAWIVVTEVLWLLGDRAIAKRSRVPQKAHAH